MAPPSDTALTGAHGREDQARVRTASTRRRLPCARRPALAARAVEGARRDRPVGEGRRTVRRAADGVPSRGPAVARFRRPLPRRARRRARARRAGWPPRGAHPPHPTRGGRLPIRGPGGAPIPPTTPAPSARARRRSTSCVAPSRTTRRQPSCTPPMTSSTIRPSSCSTSSRTPREHPLRGSGRSRPGPRALHEALPVDDCPFDWSLPTRIVDVDGRVLAHVATAARSASPTAGLTSPSPR